MEESITVQYTPVGLLRRKLLQLPLIRMSKGRQFVRWTILLYASSLCALVMFAFSTYSLSRAKGSSLIYQNFIHNKLTPVHPTPVHLKQVEHRPTRNISHLYRNLHTNRREQINPSLANSTEMANMTSFQNASCPHIPSVLIIGFEKCGTITFKNFLKRNHHFVSTRENNKGFNPFVDTCEYHRNRNVTYQRSTVKSKSKRKIIVEKLSTFGIPEKVYDMKPNMKLIAMVRDPVSRLISHFVHRQSNGLEEQDINTTMYSILDKHLPYAPENSYIFNEGMYATKLKKWLYYFGRKNIHIVNGDNFVVHPAQELRKVEAFLGLKPIIKGNYFTFNEEKHFFCVTDKSLTRCMGEVKGRRHPEVDEELVRRLHNFYRPHNQIFFQMFRKKYGWDIKWR